MFPISDVAHGIGAWLSIPIPVVGAALIGVLFAWACWRARSAYPVLKFAWKLVMGRAVAKDPEITELINVYEDLIRFRFLFGLPARTLDHAKALRDWASRHGEGLEQIKACGNYFDLESCALILKKVPGRGLQVLMLILIAALTFGFILGIAGSATDKAVLQFKQSGTWFLLSPTAARRFNGQQWSDSLCNSGITPKDAPFSVAERAELCKAFGTRATASYVRETVLQQRWSFGVLTAMLIFFLINLLSTFRQAVAASDMHERLRKAEAVDSSAQLSQ